MLTLCNNNIKEKEILKKLKCRKKIVNVQQVNLNFERFLDNAYMVEKFRKKDGKYI